MNGNQFKSARERLELSQTELAGVLCLSGKQAVSNIETGLRNPGKLTATVLRVLIELPAKRSKELQELLVSLSGEDQSKKASRR
jgi:DNA-binding transcriptional regulator YiaG